MFLKQMEVGHLAVFAYIVGDADANEAIVIDPAGSVDKIIAAAADSGLKIRYIVNTHGHVDHISGNMEMKKKTGASIVIHEDDADMLVSTPSMIFRMFGANQSPPADLTVVEGDRIAVGHCSLAVLHTPGHSPGSMSLYADSAVFTGDTLFVGAVGRTDLPGGSWKVMSRSIQTKLCTLPPDTKVFPGHNYGPSPSSTIGHEKRTNPFLT